MLQRNEGNVTKMLQKYYKKNNIDGAGSAKKKAAQLAALSIC